MSHDNVNGKVSGDLISREATLNLWCANCIITKFGKACNRTCRDIERIKAVPAVDAAPVVHGMWLDSRLQPFIGKCSKCGANRDRDNFCSHCGAKMDEGEVVND